MKLRYTCREMTSLVLQSQDRDLRPLERITMQFHWLACEGCRNFRGQARLMRVALGRWRGYRNSE
jgi:hypothetical protein